MANTSPKTIDEDTWDNRGSDPNWHSGLKVLPSHRRSRSSTRSPSTSSRRDLSPKVVPRRSRSHTTNLPDDWQARSKVLPDRFAIKSYIKHDSDEWQGTHKTLIETPERLNYTTWHSENLKVLTPDSPPHVGGRSATPPNGWWHSGLYKTFPERNMVPVERQPQPAPVRTYTRTPQLPSDGRWIAENFKVLQSSRNRPQGQHFVRDDTWYSGFKTLDRKNQHSSSGAVTAHGWLEENMKILDDGTMRPRKKQTAYVIANGDWDSGLYKTVDNQTKAIRDNTEWTMVRKTFPHQTTSPRHSKRSDSPSGWDSGLKTVPHTYHIIRAPQQGSTTTTPQYWDLENRKTLPHPQQAFAQNREFMRHVMNPRRQDMMKFQETFRC